MSMSRRSEAAVSAPPPNPSRVAELVSTLGRRIVRGDFDETGALPIEQELCAAYATGRNVVREAIKVLMAKGFVRTGRRAGTLVQPRTMWSLLDPQVLEWGLHDPTSRSRLLSDLTTLRSIIEPEIAALAATHATTVETLRLFEAYEHMELHARDPSLAIEADIGFHQRLAEAAHNQLLLSVWQSFAVLLRTNFEISIAAENGFIRNLEEHRAVADAVHKRDIDGARKAMRHLLANNEDDLRKMLQS